MGSEFLTLEVLDTLLNSYGFNKTASAFSIYKRYSIEVLYLEGLTSIRSTSETGPVSLETKSAAEVEADLIALGLTAE
jgi:hypothetical protein